jgi:hypothetical protein
MASIQEGKGDEDITTSDTTTPSIEMNGPIMRSRAQQLNRQVNLFLYSSANNLENILLLNDLIVIRNQGVNHGGNVGHRVLENQGNTHKVEIQSNSELRSLTTCPTRSLGPHCLQIDE